MNTDKLMDETKSILPLDGHQDLTLKTVGESDDPQSYNDLYAKGKSRFFDLKARGQLDEDTSVCSNSPTSSEEDISIFRSHSLLDDDDDDADDSGETGSTGNRRNTNGSSRSNSVPNDSNLIFRSHSNHNFVKTAEISSSESARRSYAQSISTVHSWDGFVRHGARLKNLVDGAMHKIRESFGNENEAKRRNPPAEENSVNEPPRQRRRFEVTEHAFHLVQERTSEVIQLQRQLKDYEVQASAMKAANNALREESASLQQRLDRTTQALRIAGSNVQKARADADAAQATAASFAQTMDSLETVVTETKRASQVLHQEHDKISAAVSLMEGKLLKKESELIRTNKELENLRIQNSDLQAAKKKWNDEQKRLNQSLDLQDQELTELKRLQEERDALERARRTRAEMVEKELRETQEMLLAATNGKAQAEKTLKELQETIIELRKSNEDIHAQMSHQQTTTTNEVNRLSEALKKADKELQKIRIDAEATEEKIQRLTAEKESAEKQMSELKSQLVLAERQVRDTSNNGPLFTTPESRENQREMRVLSTISATPNTNQSFILPPLSGSTSSSVPAAIDKENSTHNNSTIRCSICSICSKASYGLMKPCQCGGKSCIKKAHISCVNRIQPGPSVSHPGTPAPQLPIVLCSTINCGNSKNLLCS